MFSNPWHFRPLFSADKSQADTKALVHRLHDFRIQMTDLFQQPLFVNGADLFQQHNGVFGQGVFGCRKGNMCG